MGEVTISYIKPTKIKKEGEGIEWIHDRFLGELSDDELGAFLLSVRYVNPNPITIKATNLARFYRLRTRELSGYERATMVRALRECPLVGMKGNDFLAFFNELKMEQQQARQERAELIRRLQA